MLQEKESFWKIKQFWQAVAALMGTIIGAGVLGIPYVIAQTGLIPGLVVLILIGLAIMMIHLMMAEIFLRTKFRHQVVGVVKKYLGKKWAYLEFVSFAIAAFGALTAYLIGQGRVLSEMFNQPENAFTFSVIFYLIAAVVLFIGIKIIKVIDVWMVLMVVTVIIILSFYSAPHIDFANYQTMDLKNIFLTYGVLLFAFSGINAIFVVREILRGREALVHRAIIVGSSIPIILYTIFAVVVVGVTGLQTTQIATIGIGESLGEFALLLGNIFAALAMSTCFITIGLSLRQMFHFDMHIPLWLSWLLVVSVPFAIFMFISRDFIKIIEIAGSLTFGLSGVLIVATFWRAKKSGDQKPAFSLPKLHLIGWGLIIMFVVGFGHAVYELVH